MYLFEILLARDLLKSFSNHDIVLRLLDVYDKMQSLQTLIRRLAGRALQHDEYALYVLYTEIENYSGKRAQSQFIDHSLETFMNDLKRQSRAVKNIGKRVSQIIALHETIE